MGLIARMFSVTFTTDLLTYRSRTYLPRPRERIVLVMPPT